MIIFDAHVHIYDCFDLDLFFSSAFGNLSRVAKTIDATSNSDYMLLLAESSGFFRFQELEEKARMAPVDSPHWSIEIAETSLSLKVSHKDYPGMKLIVVAGRQLVTRERLELLALITDEVPPDGLALADAVSVVGDAGGVAVCPWGAGKWLGERGVILADYLASEKKHPFFLGDSGGRPVIWPEPKHFHDRGSKWVISGSDPLPIKGDETRVGGYGGAFSGHSDRIRPAADLRERLLRSQDEIQGFGSQMGMLAFARNQIGLRLQK